MNLSARFLSLFLVLVMAWAAPLSAQTPPESQPPTPAPAPADSDTPPAGSTVIVSDELHSDQNTHVSVFTGSVVVTGTNFVMTCQEMTVNFTKDNKVDVITAVGDVVITQPGRVTHSGKAQYFHDEDKFVLTDQPIIVDNKNTIKAPRITIWRTNQIMKTDGGRSTVILPPGSGSSPSTTPNKPAPTTGQ